jgi:antitoxin (DNA-binding transcriptional repressor) of toxin-antitoxin stability system
MNHHTRTWSLQDAKARLSEVIRLALTEGPQLVTIHGRPAVTIEQTPSMAEKFKGRSALDVYRSLDKGPPVDFDVPERPDDAPGRDIDLP